MAASAGSIPTKRDMLLSSLRKYYAASGGENLRTLTRLLAHDGGAAGGPSGGLSLRILDWLVTNYAKKNNVVYVLPDGIVFNVFLSYKNQLRAYSKKFFDPFCRRERLEFEDADGRPFHTTPGQLNFFKWAIQNEVVAYGLRHAEAIEADMLRSIKHRQTAEQRRQTAADAGPCDQPAATETTETTDTTEPAEPRPKRRELSRAAIKSCTKTHVRVTVRFA